MPSSDRSLLWPTRVFLICMSLLAFGLMLHPLGDPDVFIHLRDGRYWVEKHLQVDKDPFSYTAPDKPIERVEIGFRISMYLAYRLGGYTLLTLLKALAMTAGLFFLSLLVYRRWANLAVVWAMLALALLAQGNPILPERPYVVTYCLLPLVLWWLESWCSLDVKSTRQKLWFIPLLVVPWANLHPGFVVLFAFLGAYWLEAALGYWRSPDILHRQRLKHLSLVSGAAFFAGAINPIGFSIYTFVFNATSSQDFMRFLTEWAPPSLATEPLFFATLGLVWVVQIFSLRLRLAELIPTLIFSYLATKSFRNIPLFLIAALPPLAGQLSYLTARFFPNRTLTPFYRKIGLYAGSVLSAVVLLLAVLNHRAFCLGQIPGMFPEKGLAWLLEHPVNGRVLTHDIWGGYTGWMSHGQIQVFIDGRFPLFGEQLYSDYRKIIWGDPDACLPLLDRYRIQGLLVSPKNDIKLFYQLWKSRQWALVYWDDVCSLYVRKNPENLSVIKPFQYFFIDPKQTPYYDPAHPAEAWQEARRAVEITPDSYLPWFFVGEIGMNLGRSSEARQAFNEVLRRAPRHAATLYNLGMLEYTGKNFTAAEDWLRRAFAGELPPAMRARVCFGLAMIAKQTPARRNEALGWAKKALVYQPGWKEAEELAGQLAL